MLKVKSCRKSERGAVAITVALSLLALVVVAAMAINTFRFMYARQALQAAMDSAITAAAADALSQTSGDSPNIDKMVQIAHNYFKANFTLSPDLVRVIAFDPVYRDNETYDDSMVATLDAEIAVEFLGILKSVGWNKLSIPIHLETVASRPRPSPVQMVIALDNTSSMDDAFGGTTKIGALRTAAKTLVSLLMKSDYAKIGLVPFSTYIKLADPRTSDVNEFMDMSTTTPKFPWLKMADKPKPIYDCYAYDRTNCTSKPSTCYKDGVPYDCEAKSCPCTDARERFLAWDGCVYLRPAPTANLTISNPTSPPYYGSWSTASCGFATAMTNLVTRGETYTVGSKTYTAVDYLTYKIDSLRTNGAGITYIPAGLIWAWNMLTTNTVGNTTDIDTNYPLNKGFTDTEVQERKVRRALLLITDGNNTAYSYNLVANRYDGIGSAGFNANSRTQTNNEMVAICNGIKAQGIDLYVIGLQVGTDFAYTNLLENQCASGDRTAGYFFDVSTPQGLQDAFDKIGKSFSFNSLTK